MHGKTTSATWNWARLPSAVHCARLHAGPRAVVPAAGRSLGTGLRPQQAPAQSALPRCGCAGLAAGIPCLARYPRSPSAAP